MNRIFLLPLAAIFLCILFHSCLRWGDMLAQRKTIVGKYTLVEEETGGFGLYYELRDGNYIGRVNEQILAYAIRDSLLILKSQTYDKTQSYYTLNMNKDSSSAEPKNVIVDTVKASDFQTSWLTKLNLHFTDVNK